MKVVKVSLKKDIGEFKKGTHKAVKQQNGSFNLISLGENEIEREVDGETKTVKETFVQKEQLVNAKYVKVHKSKKK